MDKRNKIWTCKGELDCKKKKKFHSRKNVKFNPDLAPGTKSNREGQKGEKTITTPTLKNPLTGEIISKGESKEEITKDPY